MPKQKLTLVDALIAVADFTGVHVAAITHIGYGTIGDHVDCDKVWYRVHNGKVKTFKLRNS